MFPELRNGKEFWLNLMHGMESIWSFSDEELIESSVGIGAIQNDSILAEVGGVLSWKMS